jgi:hypothetical protein
LRLKKVDLNLLIEVKVLQGKLIGKMEIIGFELKHKKVLECGRNINYSMIR